MSELKYTNSFGESSWEDKSKHVKHITEKDIEVISEVLKEDLKQSKSALEDSEKGRPNVAEHNLKTFEAAISEMKMDIEFDESVLERISKPETIGEREWRRIFIYIIKADNKDMAKFFEMEVKEDSYYEELRDTATRVEPLSGLPRSIS